MKFWRATLAGVAVFGCISAAADTVMLGASRDNTLYESATGALSNGAGEHLFSGRTGEGKLRRGLLAFDVAAAVPAGSIVSNVTLTLHMSRTFSGPQPVALHRVLAAWGEAGSDPLGEEGSGAPAQPGDATWLHTFFDTQFWAGPGGDFMSGASAAVSVNDNGFYAWSSAELAADVQAWLDTPGQNHGWLLLGNEAAFTTTKRFDTRENAEPAYRPVLEVQYVPEPQMVALLTAACVPLLRRPRPAAAREALPFQAKR